MPRRKLKISNTFVIVAAVVAVVVGAPTWYAWWWFTDGRYPLTGETFHDFEDMDVTNGAVSRTHVFKLRNRRDADVVIEKITAGCGCTKVVADRMRISPGDYVELKTTLTISKPRERDEHAILMIEGFGPLYIWIHADGVYDREVMRKRREELTREQEAPVFTDPALKPERLEDNGEEPVGEGAASEASTPEA